MVTLSAGNNMNEPSVSPSSQAARGQPPLAKRRDEGPKM